MTELRTGTGLAGAFGPTWRSAHDPRRTCWKSTVSTPSLVLNVERRGLVLLA
jgi:hypothetical protein